VFALVSLALEINFSDVRHVGEDAPEGALVDRPTAALLTRLGRPSLVGPTEALHLFKDGKFDNFGFPDIPLPLILDLQDLVIATQIDFKVGLDVNMDGGLTGNLNGNQNGISELQLASQVYLYWFNIRVDSNNNGRVNWNDDPIELDPTRPGKWIKTTAPHIKKWDVPLDVYIGGKGLPAGHSIMWHMEMEGLILMRDVDGELQKLSSFDLLFLDLDPDGDGHERFYLKAETSSVVLADKYVDFGVMANDDGENPPFTFFPLTHEGGDRYDRVLLTAYDFANCTRLESR